MVRAGGTMESAALLTRIESGRNNELPGATDNPGSRGATDEGQNILVGRVESGVSFAEHSSDARGVLRTNADVRSLPVVAPASRAAAVSNKATTAAMHSK